MKRKRKKILARKRLSDHKAAQKAHTLNRLKERYGLEATIQDYKTMVNMIQNNEAKFVGRQSLTRTYWLLNFKDTEIIAVYRKRTRAIATVLPYEELKEINGSC